MPYEITKNGLNHLGNLIEEYQLRNDMSLDKMAQINLLLLTYWFQTDIMIHGIIFDEINEKFPHLVNEDECILKNVELLIGFGCIGSAQDRHES